MKLLLTSILFLFLAITMTSAQPIAKVKYTNSSSDTYTDNAIFQYVIGSEKVPGYEIKVCNFVDNSSKALQIKSFSNGKSAPILQVYAHNRLKYIGGILENEKGARTTIVNITIEESGSTLLFNVIGKGFSRSFTLNSGCLLKEDNKTTIFHTEEVGIWTISKK